MVDARVGISGNTVGRDEIPLYACEVRKDLGGVGIEIAGAILGVVIAATVIDVGKTMCPGKDIDTFSVGRWQIQNRTEFNAKAVCQRPVSHTMEVTAVLCDLVHGGRDFTFVVV